MKNQSTTTRGRGGFIEQRVAVKQNGEYRARSPHDQTARPETITLFSWADPRLVLPEEVTS